MSLVLSLLDDAFFSAIPAVGFAMLFNVPKRMLILCACAGALGHSLRTLVMHGGVSIEWASLVASLTIGFVGVYWSRRYLVPRPVFTVASIIPMIPGTFAFKTIIGIFTLHDGGYTAEVMASVLENGLATLFILMALSFGLALPSILIYRLRPVV